MRFRIGSALAALALAASMATVAMAQADDGTPPVDDVSANTLVAPPATEQQPAIASTLFLTLVNPVDQDVEVPLDTTQLTVQGATLPGAIVSIDGDLVDTNDRGEFVDDTLLEEGANEIVVIASDDQGNQVNTSLFVTRGE
jgi:hypothetical protein